MKRFQMRAAVTAALAVAVVLASRVPVAAAEGVAGSGDSIVPSMLRLALALVGVIALVYLVAFLLRRGGANTPSRSGRLMNVVEVLPLGPKSRLVAVRVGERVLVVGAGENSVHPVTELDPGEAEMLLEEDTGGVVPFRERLLRLAGK